MLLNAVECFSVRLRLRRKEVEQKWFKIDFCSETSATVQVESSLKAAIHSESSLSVSSASARRVTCAEVFVSEGRSVHQQ